MGPHPYLRPGHQDRGRYVMVDNGHQAFWRVIRMTVLFPQFYPISWLFSWVGLGVDACVLASVNLGVGANLQEKPNLITTHTLWEFQCLCSPTESSASCVTLLHLPFVTLRSVVPRGTDSPSLQLMCFSLCCSSRRQGLDSKLETFRNTSCLCIRNSREGITIV